MRMTNMTIGFDPGTLLLVNRLNPSNFNKFVREAVAEKARRELDKQLEEGYKSRAQETALMEDFKAIDAEGWPHE